VVDSKDNNTNKHRYVVATQDPEVRAYLRRIPGVPLIYINRSVMIMEPMGGATEELKQKEERQKFKAGLKSRLNGNTTLGKRRRDEEEGMDDMAPQRPAAVSTTDAVSTTKRKKGPKGPNPLSVKKPKARLQPTSNPNPPTSPPTAISTSAAPEESSKKKRKRKHKPKIESADAALSKD
jgi:U3 small nucleolar RNA-associated protein 23